MVLLMGRFSMHPPDTHEPPSRQTRLICLYTTTNAPTATSSKCCSLGLLTLSRLAAIVAWTASVKCRSQWSCTRDQASTRPTTGETRPQTEATGTEIRTQRPTSMPSPHPTRERRHQRRASRRSPRQRPPSPIDSELVTLGPRNAIRHPACHACQGDR